MILNQGRRIGSRRRINADINITPFVDVMLVLLVVFMVTAPALVSGIQVNLPASSSKEIDQDRNPIVVSINAAGNIYLNDDKVPENNLATELRALTNSNYERKILVRGDKSLTYAKIMQVIMAINNAGFNKVVLVTIVEDVR